MGYYIRFLKNKKSSPNWKVQYISTRKKDRRPDSTAKISKTAWDVSKSRWSQLGFHESMFFEEAQVRARQLNSQLSIKRQEEKIRQIQERDYQLRRSIPDRYFTLYTGDILYTFPKPKGSSTGSTLVPFSSKYPRS